VRQSVTVELDLDSEDLVRLAAAERPISLDRLNSRCLLVLLDVSREFAGQRGGLRLVR
jgi:hypothetical protein